MERKQIVAAYLRVSTDKQTILNQKSEVLNFCKKHDLEITTWCTETVSGTKKRKRTGIRFFTQTPAAGGYSDYHGSIPSQP